MLALKSNTSLTSIDVSNNEIRAADAAALADALKSNTPVTFILYVSIELTGTLARCFLATKRLFFCCRTM
jgi:hypothetical protein